MKDSLVSIDRIIRQNLLVESKSRNRIYFWLGLSIAIAAVYALMAMQQGFSQEYVIQEDARQHVFWLQKFADRELFRNDLIADYFQSTAPPGYVALYRLVIWLGLSPIFFSKLLPLALSIVAAGYCFGICYEIFPLPFAGFVTATILSQNLWIGDEIVSGTPRAFLYPLLLTFLYYFLRQQRLVCLLILGLQCLFYPTTALICCGLVSVSLLKPSGRFPYISKDKSDYLFWVSCLVTVGILLLPSVLSTSEFGPVVSAEQAKLMPEFQENGRNAFFVSGIKNWIIHGRRGFFSYVFLTPVTLVFGLFLPFILKSPKTFPLVTKVNAKVRVLGQILFASATLFFLAHLFLFKLYLPSRYSSHSWRIIIAIASGIVAVVLLDKLLDWIAKEKKTILAIAGAILVGLWGIVIFAYPIFLKKFPTTFYTVGKETELYEFFDRQPKDILIASLAKETNNISSFTGRSVLISPEHGNAYHLGYYRQFRQRVIDLIEAHYSLDKSVVNSFVDKYNITHWAIEKNSFKTKYLQNRKWFEQFEPYITKAVSNLNSESKPILERAIDNCKVLETKKFIVLDARCDRQ